MQYLLSKTKETTSVQSRIGDKSSWGNIADSCHWMCLSPAQCVKTRIDKGSAMDSRRRKGVKGDRTASQALCRSRTAPNNQT